MEKEELLSLVTRHGLSARVKGKEVVVEHCTFCANPNSNLELNAEMGVYHCWACGSSGTLRGFLNEQLNIVADVPVNYDSGTQPYGEVPEDHLDLQTCPVSNVELALRYLNGRGLEWIDILKYEIVYCLSEGPMKDRILFPVREYFSQAMFGYNGRTYLGTKPVYRLSFNTPVVSGYRAFRSRVHILVEGQLDGIRVHKAGHNAAVLLGAQKAHHLDAWAARIPKDHVIIILLDGDARDKAEKIQWRLSPIHPNVLRYDLPEHMDPAQLHPSVLITLVTTTIANQQGAET